MLTALAEGLRRLQESKERAKFWEVLADVIQQQKKEILGSLLLNDLRVRGGHLSAAGIWKTQSERRVKEACSLQKLQLIRMMHHATNGY